MRTLAGWLTVLVLTTACNLPQSGGVRTPAPSGGRLTALAAVRFALQSDATIKTRLPQGKLSILGASMPNKPDVAGTSAEWTLGVDDPPSGTLYQFAVGGGKVGLVASGSSLFKPDRPLIADLARGTDVADVLDSDQAVQHAEAKGGADYRARTGADVFDLDLSGFAGRPLEWSIFYSKPGTTHQTTLVLDAHTGEVARVEGTDPDFVQK